MNVGLITYNCPHLKTEQVVCRIAKYEGFSYEMFALTFKQRKSRKVLVNHRPDQADSVATELLAAKFGIPFYPCEDESEIKDTLDFYIILGAGLLSSEFVKGKRILNAHPGLLPAARGLDSFKWSIHNGVPLGVTLHYIDGDVDGGEVLAQCWTPVFETDSVEVLARRHYENEINMLSEFPDYLAGKAGDAIELCPRPPQKRMPFDIEREMLLGFPAYCRMYAWQDFHDRDSQGRDLRRRDFQDENFKDSVTGR